MTDKTFGSLVDTLRRQREDLQRQMEDTDASQVRTSTLMKAIEELRERVKRTMTEAPNSKGE